MHGLQVQDQKETIIGLPSASSEEVLICSPLTLSTFTEGIWAKLEIESKLSKNAKDSFKIGFMALIL